MQISKPHFLRAGLAVLCGLLTAANAADTLNTTAVDTVVVEALAVWATHNSIRIESNTTDGKVSATVSDDNTCPTDPV